MLQKLALCFLLLSLCFGYSPVASARYMQSDPIGLEGQSWSTYSYVNGNPVSGVDPSGLLLELTQAASEEQREAYNAAMAYLKQDQEAAAMLAKVEASPIRIVVEPGDLSGEDVLGSDSNVLNHIIKNSTLQSAIVSWLPFSAAICQEGVGFMDDDEYVSPALVLLHEIGHAFNEITNLTEQMARLNRVRNDGYSNDEEYKVITEIEVPFARRNCECMRTRNDQGDHLARSRLYKDVDSPLQH